MDIESAKRQLQEIKRNIFVDLKIYRDEVERMKEDGTKENNPELYYNTCGKHESLRRICLDCGLVDEWKKFLHEGYITWNGEKPE